MNTIRSERLLFQLIATTILGVLWTVTIHADQPVVSWQRIEGIVPHPNTLNAGILPGGINPVAFPWSVARGRAQFDTNTGRLQFDVNGLSMGGSFRIGTTGIVTKVKGTILCRISGDHVDTDAVRLSQRGNASYAGLLGSPVPCEASDMIFLLRVAEVESDSVPQIQDLWLASGAARRIKHRD